MPTAVLQVVVLQNKCQLPMRDALADLLRKGFAALRLDPGRPHSIYAFYPGLYIRLGRLVRACILPPIVEATNVVRAVLLGRLPFYRKGPVAQLWSRRGPDPRRCLALEPTRGRHTNRERRVDRPSATTASRGHPATTPTASSVVYGAVCGSDGHHAATPFARGTAPHAVVFGRFPSVAEPSESGRGGGQDL